LIKNVGDGNSGSPLKYWQNAVHERHDRFRNEQVVIGPGQDDVFLYASGTVRTAQVMLTFDRPKPPAAANVPAHAK
jgi:hypothetical protein